jgi:mono/diheme cytochrome c family protein
MRKCFSILLVAALSSTASLGIVQKTATINRVPIRPTSPASGQQMYTNYCAACHGTTGAGNGPTASALKTAPADLTTLSQRNHGAFPTLRVRSVLEFGVPTPPHGTAEMPIWSSLMLGLNPDVQRSSGRIQQRLSNLTDYLKTLQK